ncbi:enhanced serine sensitivity protein SseB [Paludicola sp. MB14-C6]|uniref:enhanced serine sensitivity protein SseB n=1 Tax=Paludihabitans sp. MB14-C6 TaxID=3070656 RepID=UPI0027DE579B|nr:enhanced serine sensitivity protein SseB [Paludicola sp. MB14-C6]WMJ22904.1 enhanced serine sensitivity protein SseB [Paludicola sp. MB14-C6]
MKVDVNKPLENPKLKQLFLKRKSELTNDELNAVLNDICEEVAMNAYFLSVIKMENDPIQNGDGTAVFQQDTTISFPMLTTETGASYYPVFIDWEELSKWDEVKGTQPNTLILSFDDYAAMVIDKQNGHGIVVNPFSDNFVIDRDLLIHLRRIKQITQTGHAEMTVEKDTTVHLGEPANYPIDMINAIKKAVKHDKDINTMWLRLMEKDSELSYLVIVGFEGDRKKAFSLISNAASPYLNNMYLDMVPFKDTFGSQAVEGVEPFYQRKNGLFRR